jgi:hypothetical protein
LIRSAAAWPRSLGELLRQRAALLGVAGGVAGELVEGLARADGAQHAVLRVLEAHALARRHRVGLLQLELEQADRRGDRGAVRAQRLQGGVGLGPLDVVVGAPVAHLRGDVEPLVEQHRGQLHLAPALGDDARLLLREHGLDRRDLGGNDVRRRVERLQRRDLGLDVVDIELLEARREAVDDEVEVGGRLHELALLRRHVAVGAGELGRVLREPVEAARLRRREQQVGVAALGDHRRERVGEALAVDARLSRLRQLGHRLRPVGLGGGGVGGAEGRVGDVGLVLDVRPLRMLAELVAQLHHLRRARRRISAARATASPDPSPARRA